MRILLRNFLPRIHQQQYDVGIFDGLQRLYDRKFLDRLKYFAALSDARRVDNGVLLAVAEQRNIN